MTRAGSLRGFTVTEAMVALAVLTILASAAMDGGRAEARAESLAQDATAVRLAASSRLEAFPRAALLPGTRAFDAGRPGLAGSEEVREVEPGLFEVRVVVAAPSGARADLVTRVAAGGRSP